MPNRPVRWPCSTRQKSISELNLGTHTGQEEHQRLEKTFYLTRPNLGPTHRRRPSKGDNLWKLQATRRKARMENLG